MRFHFCGGLDCPDWVLAQIALLSKLSSIKVKLLCLEVSGHLAEDKVNYEKLAKLTADAKFEQEEVKGSFAALSFIIFTAAKYNTDAAVLGNELQQLGFPKEHATAISRVFSDKVEMVRVALKDKSLKLNQLLNVKWSLSHLDNFEVDTPHATFEVETKGDLGRQVEKFTITEDRLEALINELRAIEMMM